MDISQKILSDVVIFQKYAKYIPEIKRREVWEELCERNMAMHIRRFPALKEEIKAVYRQYVFTRRFFLPCALCSSVADQLNSVTTVSTTVLTLQ